MWSENRKKVNDDILFFEPSSSHIAGSQKVSLTVLNYLKNRFNIYVVTRKKPGDYRQALSKFNIVGAFPLELILNSSIGTGNFKSKTSFTDKLLFLFAVIVCNFYSLFTVIRFKPKYVYVTEPRGLMLSSLLLYFTPSKVIWHLHSDIPFNKFVGFLIDKLVHVILVPSNSVANNLNLKTDVKVVYNGFDFSGYENKNKNKRTSSDSFVITYLGTHHPHKGVHNMLSGLKLFEERHATDVKFLVNIYGGFSDALAWYKKLIDDLTEQLTAIDVVYHGWTVEPVTKLCKTDVLIFPSVINQQMEVENKVFNIKSSEALPTVLIESLSVGTPVIATNAPGVQEIVCDDRSGIIIDESEPELIFNALDRLFSCYSYYKPDAELIREKFSIAKMKSKLNQVFV